MPSVWVILVLGVFFLHYEVISSPGGGSTCSSATTIMAIVVVPTLNQKMRKLMLINTEHDHNFSNKDELKHKGVIVKATNLAPTTISCFVLKTEVTSAELGVCR